MAKRQLSSKQKWGIGLVISGAALGTVGGLAIGNVPIPAYWSLIMWGITGILEYFGIRSFTAPPTEPPAA